MIIYIHFGAKGGSDFGCQLQRPAMQSGSPSPKGGIGSGASARIAQATVAKWLRGLMKTQMQDGPECRHFSIAMDPFATNESVLWPQFCRT